MTQPSRIALWKTNECGCSMFQVLNGVSSKTAHVPSKKLKESHLKRENQKLSLKTMVKSSSQVQQNFVKKLPDIPKLSPFLQQFPLQEVMIKKNQIFEMNVQKNLSSSDKLYYPKTQIIKQNNFPNFQKHLNSPSNVKITFSGSSSTTIESYYKKKRNIEKTQKQFISSKQKDQIKEALISTSVLNQSQIKMTSSAISRQLAEQIQKQMGYLFESNNKSKMSLKRKLSFKRVNALNPRQIESQVQSQEEYMSQVDANYSPTWSFPQFQRKFSQQGKKNIWTFQDEDL